MPSLDSPTSSRFVFVTCQAGAEAALKRELSRDAPNLRLAYSRPGLVTLKSDTLVDADLALSAVFARTWGASLGRGVAASDVIAVARGLPQPLRLQVWERAAWRPDEVPPQVALGTAAARARAEIIAESVGSSDVDGGARFAAGECALPGDLVLDVVVPPDGGGQPGEIWLIGCHRHCAGRSPFAGGEWPVEVPAEAPSRAYRKLEEGLAWSGAPMVVGDIAVEIGSAPGGASYALARRGIEVWGVDPGAMDTGVLAYRHPSGAQVHHLPIKIGSLRREALPQNVDWLLMDVNLAPQVALHSISRLVPLLRPHLRGVLFTLKLNEWRFADMIPMFVERIRGLGASEVRATQLPANRQEICVWGRLSPR